MKQSDFVRCPGCDVHLVVAGRVIRTAAYMVCSWSTGRRQGVELECRKCGARAHPESKRVFENVARCAAGVFGPEAREWVKEYSRMAPHLTRVIGQP